MSQAPAASTVIWQLGDPWRDLRDDIITAGAATIVTAHLTTHLIDLDQCRTTRLPSGVGSLLAEDGTHRNLVSVELATPCGVVTHCDPVEVSQRSTPLVLVLRGIHLDWWDSYLPQLRESAAELTPGLDPTHPATNCGALYCKVPTDTEGQAET